ncbi:UNVERIFIED_CONTAM: hypothetical protein Slati_1456400 [Sesamum latifolium]|uniref:Secreted protein n=1 Tax=Sesamum latifolium TaxID=2727402 RepID=A0AAW2X697_9LAMI
MRRRRRGGRCSGPRPASLPILWATLPSPLTVNRATARSPTSPSHSGRVNRATVRWATSPSHSIWATARSPTSLRRRPPRRRLDLWRASGEGGGGVRKLWRR